MPSLSEIEKLEARYNENPEGRYFAPLADAYRKAGRLDEALEVVRAGLGKHPDYLSAHIVLGRCQLDKKDDAAALQAFSTVLTLDAENIIALKSLAEISERTGDTLAARRWLQKLLLVDSMNQEAEADLYRLGGPLPEEGAEAPVAEAAGESLEAALAEAAEESLPPPPPPEITESPTEPMPALALEPPPEPAIEPLGESAPEAPPAEAPSEAPTEPVPALELEPTALSPEEPLAPAAGLTPFDESLEWGAGERMSGAIRVEDLEAAHQEESVRAAAIEFLEPAAAPAPSPAGEAWDAGAAPPAEMNLEGASAPEEAGVASVEAAASLEPEAAIPGAAPEESAGLPLIMPEDVTPPEELARPSAKLVQLVSPAPVEPAEAAGGPQPMLTETMGDLYLKQGFRAEAADVYRRLLEQRPDDASLRSKLEALQGPPPSLAALTLGAESVGNWLQRLARASLSSPQPAPEASSEGPTPMEAAFAAPEAESPPAAAVPAESEMAGQPARPATDAFSLDQIFGAPGGQPVPPPTTPASGPAPGAAGASFDEFFGGAPEPDSVRPRQSESGTPGEDDLGSFNAWLQGLKK